MILILHLIFFSNQEFVTFDVAYGASVKKSQLELYLEELRVDWNQQLDILQFWKQSQFRYPELAVMARDILSIPVSTVASESAFSVGGKVLDQYRSSLKPDLVEAICCCKDWLRDDIDGNMEEMIDGVINLDLTKEDSSVKCSSSFQFTESY